MCNCGHLNSQTYSRMEFGNGNWKTTLATAFQKNAKKTTQEMYDYLLDIYIKKRTLYI